MKLYEAIRIRRSIRKYKSLALPEEKLERILSVVSDAPSAKNLQPWKFIVVRDAAVKEKLISACNNQSFIAEAPVVLVGCALVSECFGNIGGYMRSWSVDLAIVMDHLSLAATAEGLGSCWIGSFKEKEVKEVLRIPEEVRVVGLMPIGYPDETPVKKARKSREEIICEDVWG